MIIMVMVVMDMGPTIMGLMATPTTSEEGGGDTIDLIGTSRKEYWFI